MSTIRCPSCHRILQRPAGQHGSVAVRCPSCAAVFDITPERAAPAVPPPRTWQARPTPESTGAAEPALPPSTNVEAAQVKRPFPWRTARWCLTAFLFLLIPLAFLGVALYVSSQPPGTTKSSGRYAPGTTGRSTDDPHYGRAATVGVESRTNNNDLVSSGFLVERSGDSGFVVTNYQRLQLQELRTDLRVIFFRTDGTEEAVRAELLFAHEQADLAVLHVTCDGLPAPLSLANRTQLSRGQPIRALGVGEDVDKRSIHTSAGTLERVLNGFTILRFDQALSPTWSGGPLVNNAGQVEEVIPLAMLRKNELPGQGPKALEQVLPGLMADFKVQMFWTTRGELGLAASARKCDPFSRLTAVELIALPRAQVARWPKQWPDGTWTPLAVRDSDPAVRIRTADVAEEVILPRRTWQAGEWVFQLRLRGAGVEPLYSAPYIHPGIEQR